MYLITPLKNRDVEKLSAGDVVYLSGRICTARDKAHERALREGTFPVDLRGGAIFHCGPLAEKKGGKWRIVSIGPTTSSRMNPAEVAFIEKFGIKAVIGKGGMNRVVAEAMKKNKAVYLSMTGGCAAATASQFKEVSGVEWLDLGMPEAVWVLEADKLGPLVVGIDSKGNSLYDAIARSVEKRLEEITARLK